MNRAAARFTSSARTEYCRRGWAAPGTARRAFYASFRAHHIWRRFNIQFF